MAKIEDRLAAMGFTLPEALQVRPGMRMPFSWVRLCGNRAYISGHVPTNVDGTLAQPLGKVGAEVTAEQGYEAAKLVALAHLGSLKRALGDLDLVTGWLRVFAMVNVAPGFNETPLVTNGYSDLIIELYGEEAGTHARSSIGMMVPLNAPVNCEAEVEIAPVDHASAMNAMLDRGKSGRVSPSL
jgi:enamine deaminase RidA (YjgF/YER057c/UK114 family)